jgi:dolichol-phosphate mannosyltransferase
LTEEQQPSPATRSDGIEVLQNYLPTLLAWGFVRRVATTKGARYEITEAGSSFLQEFQKLNHDLLEPPIRSRIAWDSALQKVVKNQVTVVLPVLNEEEAIGDVIEEVKTAGYGNVLVIDGYSTDSTAEIAKSVGATVLFQHGAGKAGAVKTAVENVNTPFIAFMDGDQTYDPRDIWRLLNHNHKYGHVIGARDRKHIPRLHRLGNWIISNVFSLLFALKISDVCSGMYLLESGLARELNVQEHGFIVEIELAAQSASRENLTEVPISYRPRIGERKLSTWKNGIGILSAAFSLARRYNPILLYSSLAGLSVLPAVAVLGWVALQQLTRHVWHSGVALVGIMFLLIAAQAFTLASVSILTKHTENRLAKQLTERN